MNHIKSKGGNKMLGVLEIEYIEIRIAIKIIWSCNSGKEDRIVSPLVLFLCAVLPRNLMIYDPSVAVLYEAYFLILRIPKLISESVVKCYNIVLLFYFGIDSSG